MNPPSRSPSVDELLTHAGWIQSLARGLLRDASAAEDLVQETWIAALTNTRRGVGPTRAWLAAIVRNLARQRARSEGARESRERASASDELVASPQELLERMERQRLLVEAVTRLHEPQRTAVILRYYEGLTAAEIARRLGEKPGTVRQRLKRGLAGLRDELDERFGDHQAWLTALIPLAALPPIPTGTGAAAGPALGGIVLVKKVLLALAAILLIGGALFVLREDPIPERPREMPAAAALEVGQSVGDGEGESGLSAVGSGDEIQREPVEPAEEAPASGLSIGGRVLAPPGYAAEDETLEVFALGETRNYREFVADAIEELEGGVLIARSKIAGDGSFTILLPEDLKRAHFMVRGRYLYLGQSVEVELAELAGPLVLDALCGAWIHGTVAPPEDASGSGDSPVIDLAGTPLTFWTSDLVTRGADASRFRARLALAEDRAFELRATPPTSAGSLLVLPDQCAARLVDLGELAPCEERELDVRLHTGGTLRGAVVDGAGHPVVGARVFAELRGRFFGFDDARVRESETASDGSFELAALPPGSVRVSARHPGYLESKKTDAAIVDRQSTVDLVIELSSGQSLEGLVTWADGSPAGDVAISASFDQGYQFGPSSFNALRGASGAARSGADGRFRVSGLGAGPFVVQASATPAASSPSSDAEEVHRARLDGVAGGQSGLRLVLLPAQTLRGRLVDARSESVTSFEVHATRVSDGAIGEIATDEDSGRFESADGRFALGDLIGGDWRVVAIAEGCAPSEARMVTLPQGDEPLVITVHPAATVHGVVISSDGTPVEGATVELDRRRSDWQELMAGGPRAPSTTSDATGSFALGGLPPGEVDIVATASGFARSDPLSVELAPGEEIGGEMLVLGRGGRVTGEVYDEGRPAAGRMVNLIKWGRGDFDTLIASTGEDGRFFFEHVDPGGWQVVAVDMGADLSAEDGEPAVNSMMDAIESAAVKVEEGGEHHVVLGAPPVQPIRVHGMITRGGEPCRPSMITFLPIDPKGPPRAVIANISGKGRYEATLDGGGPYLVSLQSMKGAAGEISSLSFERAIPDRTEHRLDLELPGGGIAGRVTGPEGEPAAGARITLMPGREAGVDQVLAPRYAEISTDASGRYEIADLVPGSYLVSAGGALFHESATGARYARVVREVRVDGEEWVRDVDFSLPEPGRIEVRVSGPAGEPAAGASIYARAADGNVLEILGLCKTDASGGAIYSGLSPGSYTLCARTRELASEESHAVHVEAGETARAELDLEEAGWLVVKTRDADREPAAAALSVTDSRGFELASLLGETWADDSAATSSLTGEHRVGPLPPGSYRVTAVNRDGAIESKPVRVRANSERKVTLRFD